MRVAVVGAGLAAASAVDELRQRGHEGSIDLFGAERHLPYHRPPLSKGVLLGAEDEAPSSSTTAVVRRPRGRAAPRAG